jgi:hypothetical protein
MIIPQSYAAIKIAFLILFLLSHVYSLYVGKKFTVYPLTTIFYILVIVAGIVGCLVGFLNGAGVSGIYSNFKLWVLWSFAYLLVITVLLQGNKLKEIHYAIAISGILIFFINAVGMYAFYFQSGIIPSSVIDEMDLKVGFHEGYVQMTAHNIGSLLFITPYLIAVQLRKDFELRKTWLTKLSLFLSLTVAIFSGRRALWLCIIVSLIFIGLISMAIFRFKYLTRTGKYLFFLTLIGGALATFIIFFANIIDNPTIKHLQDAFSAEDERSIQKGYLINGFLQYPILGSGFGLGAGYERSEKAGWLYELSYYQLLFNFGIVGVTYFCILFGFYFKIILKKIKLLSGASPYLFGIFIGFLSFSLGAYSNPYFMSFDFIFYIGMIPFITSFRTRVFTHDLKNKYIELT